MCHNHTVIRTNLDPPEVLKNDNYCMENYLKDTLSSKQNALFIQNIQHVDIIHSSASPPPTFSFAPSGSGPKPSNSSTTSASPAPVFGASSLTTTSSGPSLFGGSAAPATTGFGSGFSFKPTTTSGDAKPFSFATGSTNTARSAANKDPEGECVWHYL